MANRLLRDGILDSERFNRLSWEGQALFVRLIAIADDFGRGDGRIAIIRSKAFPLLLEKVSEADVMTMMQECSSAGLLSLYKVQGKPYFEITNFGQRLRMKTARFPENPDSSKEQVPAANLDRTINTESDLISIWFNDLPNSQELERIAVDLGMSADHIKTRINDFRKSCETSYPNFNKFATHFKNWLRKSKEKQTIEPATRKRNFLK